VRPKLLEIEGLQSFRELQRIDFDTLGQTGLFGIFGPTGSGKSTVLDAITFALYGKVKRADRGTQGIINANLNQTRVSFTFELLRDGTRKTYRVEREYKRKKNTANSCLPRVARLIEITDVGEIPLCDKASEVSSSIEELLGLSHDDFTRAVVLPQNSFQEFLLLDNAQKRSMLERIFYLEEYGKNLLEKVSRKLAGLNLQKERLSGELAAYSDATEKALEEAMEAMESAKAERERVEQDLKQLEEEYKVANEVWQLVQDLASIEAKEQLHLALKEEIAKKKVLLSKAEKAEGLQDLLFNRKDLSLKLRETETKLQGILAKLPGITSQLDEAAKQYESIKKEAETKRPALLIKKARLEDALREKEAILDLRHTVQELEEKSKNLLGQITEKQGKIIEERNRLDLIEQKIITLQSEIEPLRVDPDYRQQVQEGVKLEDQVLLLRDTVEENRKKVEELDYAIQQLEADLSKVDQAIQLSREKMKTVEAEKLAHEALKPADRSSLLKEKEEINRLERVVDILDLRDKEIKQIQGRLETELTSLKKACEREKTQKELKEEAETRCQQMEADLQLARQAMEGYSAYILAKNLMEGKPCPVCGSEQHPRPATQTEEAEIGLLEQQLKTA